MTIDPQRAQALFLAALELSDAAARRVLLERECGGDEALRRRVEALLSAHDATGYFDDALSGQALQATIDAPATMQAGTEVVGRYKLIEAIGEGGMGSVWLAEQKEPVRRRVAIKLIKAGMDSRQVLARFEAERQALAMMDHPNIAKVLDGGMTDQGRPFFVMEYVRGVPLTEYCDNARLSLKERLNLFLPVCQAVQHAHQKGIIHRDLKPSNILVYLSDGKPVPKVIDFGLAKAMHQSLTDQSLYTAVGMMVGTPLYMSPEQAGHNSLDVDTRTDIYSLGVILYELLTGTTPLERQQMKEAAYNEILRLIKEVDPPKPSSRLSGSASLPSVAAQRSIEPRQLSKSLAGDLDWIVMKALDKERSRRYETANGLARDIDRYLNDEAVEARPPSAAYRAKKFVRRNRLQVAAAAAVAVALVFGLAGTGLALKRALNAESELTTQLVETEKAQRAEKARADELKQVSDFQSSMLNQIDTTKAGLDLMDDMRNRFAASLEKAGVPEEERTARVEALRQELVRVNATDAAVAMINRTILQPAVEAIDAQFKDQPLVDAQLRQALADLYCTIGLYDAAFPLQESALATRRNALGEEHADTLVSLASMGALLLNQDRLAEAETCLREALEKSRRVMGEEHQNTLRCTNNLGVLLRNQGKMTEAEQYYRDSLENRRRVLGEEHPDTLTSINNVGFLLQSQGKLIEAEPYFREALEKSRLVLGEEHPDTLRSINNLGGLLMNQGRLAEAEPYIREAQDKFRRILGEEHPHTLRAINHLGVLLQTQGRLAEAEPYRREVLEKSRRLLGEEHTETIINTSNMGSLLRQQGKLADAEPYLREALDKFRRILGEEHPHTLASIGILGQLLEAQGRLDEAEPYFHESLEKSRRVLGEEHPDTLRKINNMGAFFKSQGKLSDAGSYYREGLETSRRVLGEEHPITLIAASNLGSLLQAQGRLADAEPYYREGLETSRRVLGEEHPSTLIAISNMGSLLEAQGRLAEAEPHCLEALEKRRRLLGDEHPDTLVSMNIMARLLEHQGRLAEAEQYRLEVLEKGRRLLGPEHPDTLIYISNMGSLLQKQGRLAEAEPYCLEALETRRRVLGQEHPHTLVSIGSMGALRLVQGKYQEAIDLLAAAEPTARKAFAGGHAKLLATYLTTLGRARVGLGYDAERFTLAEANLVEAHPVLLTTSGESHKLTRDCVQALIDLYTGWHTAEPDQGYDAKTAEWQKKLDDHTVEATGTTSNTSDK